MKSEDLNNPFLPFTRPTLDEATIADVVAVLKSGWLATGPKVAEFETQLARYLGGGRPVRAVTSATGGLEIALEACNIGPGDEVITPAMSFVATANVILRVGAKPVFVDVDLDTRNLQLDAAEEAINERTKALMPVHFAGLPMEMERLYGLSKRHGLRVIEDAAHAIGSSWRGQKIGSFGDIVSFSFHPNKNMTTIEGGALSVADEATAARIDRLRFHGITRDAAGEMDVMEAAGKFNLSDVAAAVGLGQLAKLDAFNAKRRALVSRYFERLETDPPCGLPAAGDDGHSWHMFAVRLPLEALRISRIDFIERMKRHGIGVGVHYPAIHLFSVYRALGYREGQFPNAERIGRETVTLPLFPAMEACDVDRVCDAMNRVFCDARR